MIKSYIKQKNLYFDFGGERYIYIKGYPVEVYLKVIKSSAFLINVSRGEIIDESVLLQVLKKGEIARCGLDVFSGEPLQKQSSCIYPTA
jgi:hypothetical protein